MAKMCNLQKHEPPSKRYVKDISQAADMNESALQADCGDEMVDLGLYTVNSKGKSGSEYQVQLSLKDKQVTMEVDTGSAVSMVFLKLSTITCLRTFHCSQQPFS